MSEPIKFREIKLEGGCIIIRPEREDLGRAMALGRGIKKRLYQLEVKEYRKKRSLDANAYAWVLIHKLAAAMHLKPVEVYREAIRDVGDNFTPLCIRKNDAEKLKRNWESRGLGWICEDLGPSQVPGCVNIAAFHGSSLFTSSQMTILIDNLVQDCKALDIEVLTPDKLALLKEEWDA